MNWNNRGKIDLNKNINLLIVGLLITSIVTTMIWGGSSRPIFLMSNGEKDESPSLKLFCQSFISQIINKKLHKEMVEPDIFEILVENNYSVLSLVGSEVPLFTEAKQDNCAVIIKDKIGLRRFDIWVNKSFEYPFVFRVRKVDEPSLEG